VDYSKFLDRKTHLHGDFGFEPTWLPDYLFDFQRALVEWSTRQGRAAILADCGLGKTPMQLVWAENVCRHTDGKVLILTPLAVGAQTVTEATKFGVEAEQSRDGHVGPRITVTNYEQLEHFDPTDFVGVVCDESSILKNSRGTTKDRVTRFMTKMPYRLLCTATCAPNDYTEIGTSSEALGEMAFMDMISTFFKADDGRAAIGRSGHDSYRFGKGSPFQSKFRFRGHSEEFFWRWVCSWARAIRKPSDMGFDDGKFILPEMSTNLHVVKARERLPGMLFDLPAVTLEEQRHERRRTIDQRCDMAASIANGTTEPVICWCHLNDEGQTLARMIPDAEEVAGAHDDEHKERVLTEFAKGNVRVLVTKPKIGGFGLNFQHCSRQTFFPSHSFEQWYQAIRRSWRFGQTRPVTIDVITSECESRVLSNMQRKAEAASQMFERLVANMNDELRMMVERDSTKQAEVPAWM
jgi:hypothetical protein